MVKLANNGWVAEVTIHEGPSLAVVRRFVVGAGMEAEAISAVRGLPGIYPEDDITLSRQLSQSEIEAMQLPNGVQIIPTGVPV